MSLLLLLRHPLSAALAVLVAPLLAGCSEILPAETEQPTSSADSVPTEGDTADTGGDPTSFGSIPQIVSEVQPSVVSIQVIVEQRGQQATGAGSGVIYDGEGHIVTNEHVVGSASEIAVVLANGEQLPAELVASDPRSDLAVISVDRAGLPSASFTDEVPDVGELAVAMGNPLGLQNSATAGIVSGLGRSLPVVAGTVLVDLLQTDAPISPGNSGGALVNADAEVIGINVAQAGAQGAENLGFAIPAYTVVTIVEQLLETGEVVRPYLGIRAATLTPQVVERFGLEVEAGVVVAAVEEGGPAAAAGLEPGDVIVGVAEQEVQAFGDIATVLRGHEPGDVIDVTFVRDGQERTIEVTLAEMPAPSTTATPTAPDR